MKKQDVNNRYREEEKEELVNNPDVKEESDNVEINSDNEIILQLQEQIKELKNEVLLSKANEINFKKRLEEDRI